MIDDDVVEKISCLAGKLKQYSHSKKMRDEIGEKVREKLKEYSHIDKYIFIVFDDEGGGHQFYEGPICCFTKKGIEEVISHNLLKDNFQSEPIDENLKLFFDSLFEKKIWALSYRVGKRYVTSLSDAACPEDIIGYIRY